jgi:hypothetical protein
MSKKVGDKFIYGAVGSARMGQVCTLIWKSKNPFNVSKPYLVEFGDGTRLYTGGLKRLPKGAPEVKAIVSS